MAWNDTGKRWLQRCNMRLYAAGRGVTAAGVGRTCVGAAKDGARAASAVTDDLGGYGRSGRKNENAQS